MYGFIPCWMPRTRSVAEPHSSWSRPEVSKLRAFAVRQCRKAKFPIPGSAPAFGGAIESKDTVSQGSPRELSQTVSSLLGDASDRRVYLFPVMLRQNVVAIPLCGSPTAITSTLARSSFWCR